MTRGRPFEPGNRYGRGRPKGSPNKQAQRAQKLFLDHAPAIMALAINKSREDAPMLRMLVSRIVPRQRDLPIRVGQMPMKTLEDLDRACEATLKKATTGKIALSEAQEVLAMVENRRRVLVAQDLERRLSALENSQTGSNGRLQE